MGLTGGGGGGGGQGGGGMGRAHGTAEFEHKNNFRRLIGECSWVLLLPACLSLVRGGGMGAGRDGRGGGGGVRVTCTYIDTPQTLSPLSHSHLSLSLSLV